MKTVRLLCVGKIKTPYWKKAAEHYADGTRHFFRLEEENVRDAPADLPLPARNELEGERLLKLLRPHDVVICMDEHGENPSSTELARFLRTMHDAAHSPCFIIGGAYGLGPGVLAAARHTFSFGRMTFPHELARVLLLEQLYRAGSILAGKSYHH